ncbi:GNAT family N-acetyltransferase [Streptomyces sp. NPDC091387]|uniref:GNAT family N-acetyltransferase n=1 Tax=Streptomyces sp. NPDC091387 TaxID=3365998 RepID=UPI00382A3577
MPEVVVRPRTSADIPRAASALVAVHAVDGYPVEGVDHPQEWLTATEALQAWVAVADGDVVGHVSVNRPAGEGAVALWKQRAGADETKVGVLARLFVLPDARKRSVGERLVRAAQAYGDRHGLRLVLDVMVKDSSAIRLYRRLGWEEIGRIVHPLEDGEGVEAVALVSPAEG